MILITENQFNTSNIDNTYFLTLDEENKKRYLKNYSFYYNYLIQFISKIVEIQQLDQILIKSKNEYTKVNPEEMDIYQYMNSPFYNYFYIRNNISIERLSPEELLELERFVNQNKETIDPEIESFINKTILKVIIENPNMDFTTMINYGPFEIEYMSENASIVLGLRFEEDEDYTKANYIELRNNKETEIDFLTSLIKTKYIPIIKQKLGIGFSIFKYNKESVKTISMS